ncbi:MAG: thiopurine S-methyltransferase [Litoreibacter sp.]|uniref:thiopurine S-methyltransferase n=1 Tax=Litoreibacter sp. TaxID=1969459 RepID=UPI003297E263
MDANFWHDRWETGRTAFHEGKPNKFLVKYIKALNLPKGARIFLPLCGKTHDIAWLLAQGYHVIGAELSAIAVDQLFETLGVEPSRQQVNDLTHLSADHIDIYVGDIFCLTAGQIGHIDAIYDRAALVALPDEMRQNYGNHLVGITKAATQLLLTFQYDQTKLDGPPFSVPEEMVRALYSSHYTLTRLAHETLNGGMKGQPATEEVWHLTPPP